MRPRQSMLVLLGLCIGAMLSTSTAFAQGGMKHDKDYKVENGLLGKMTGNESTSYAFFVVLSERPDLNQAHQMQDRDQRGRFVVQQLRNVAEQSQTSVRSLLKERGVEFTAFWVENKIYVPNGTLSLARELAQLGAVVSIQPEITYAVPEPMSTTATTSSTTEWNISQIRADVAWAAGVTGSGVVVANIDTGVQYNHPALASQYRGKTSSGYSHTGNWYDPTGTCTSTPCDNNGHGTHTMGTMVGSDSSSNLIGVAPGAKWIACKGCSSSSCASSKLIACAQWILDPLGDGSGANQPDIVNNSWGGTGGDSWYQSYVQNWVAAGIFPAFSAGNSGPNCKTANSPGDYSISFASGATNSSDAIASYSSRGPSAFGSSIVKPDVTAPGVSVRSSIPTDSYATYSGTSMASPHTAGTVALIWSGATSYSGQVTATEQILKDTAVKLTTTQTCGSISANTSPNNTYGYGRLDAFAAVSKAQTTTVNTAPTVTIGSPSNGASYSCPASVTFQATATDTQDGSLSSTISWSDGSTSIGTGTSVTKSYACTDSGTHNITASVTDSGGLTGTSTITITVVNSSTPTAPSNLTASVSGKTVTLRWKDNSTNETAFKLERTSGSSWVTVSSTIAAVSGSGSTVSYTNKPGTGTFQYRVSALNGSYSSATSSVVSVTVR